MLSTREIAALWRGVAHRTYDWRPTLGHCRDGHGGGMIAMSDELGRPAYLKPRKPLVPEAAALEKIASDLAHDLGVAVPPVVLSDPPPGWVGVSEIGASLVLYGFQLHWGAASHGVQLRDSGAAPEDPRQSARAAIREGTRWGKLILNAAVVGAARASVLRWNLYW